MQILNSYFTEPGGCEVRSIQNPDFLFSNEIISGLGMVLAQKMEPSFFRRFSSFLFTKDKALFGYPVFLSHGHMIFL